ncbi:MAG: methyl-accepting chemotaxis protein [Waddliaceae bacterium]|jgi:methyl-accepting chemotaxis protein|nr:methyl-accepting chemotaxis protein [Waddliaceae bacterium]MBT3578921.1 methyl-accepting chemotaxis protein [Waddliaceae bacterium]MBT4445520.1 methyl-accepting chemotaxis protein [Waddliaceae bacterium]MBT6929011.1 methyl-accepting chemotaxis protein [Waddliaceae bacterium]MBT7264009.1 methyl-accepting chemotaxis protein [Waddliaceae bacterium]
MKGIFFKKLKTKLVVLLLCISLIPLVGMGWFSYSQFQKTIEKEAFTKLQAAGESREAHIIDYFEHMFLTVKAMSFNDVIENIEDAIRIQEEIDGEYSELTFDEIFVMNKEGMIIASSEEENIGIDKNKDSYFVGAIENDVYLKDVYKSLSTGNIGFVISVPIKDIHSNAVSGVLAVRVSIEGLNIITNDKVGMGDTGEMYIINEDDYMITASRFEKGDSVILNQRVFSKGVVEAHSVLESTLLGKDYRDIAVLGYYSAKNIEEAIGKKWTIVAEIDAAEAFAPAIALRNVMILIVIIMAAVVAVVAMFIAKKIATPVLQISGLAAEVSQGDLTKSIAVESHDEIGALSKSFTAMVDDLNNIISQIQKGSSEIAASSAEILSSSQQQVANANEQAAAINQTASSTQEMMTSAEQVGENIAEVAKSATHAMEGMAKIKEAISKTGVIVTSLNEKSQKIGQITDVINEVTNQTNLLAVNAAIEAKRAGEYGLGFTAVADEIRKLSDSTAKSTKDITALIEIIQHEMSNAIISMEESANSVEEEERVAEETAARTKEISMSSNQQISTSNQISEAMNEINAAMSQITQGAQESTTAAQAMAELGEALKKMVDKFTVKEEV